MQEPSPSSWLSPWGARLRVARPSLIFGSVLLVAEVIVDDGAIGGLHAHHLLRLHAWTPQLREQQILYMSL